MQDSQQSPLFTWLFRQGLSYGVTLADVKNPATPGTALWTLSTFETCKQIWGPNGLNGLNGLNGPCLNSVGHNVEPWEVVHLIPASWCQAF